MLTQEDNNIITRTGPGTPGGDLMRQYWLPAALSSEVPAPDCTPHRVRLLSEDLIAFRDSSGNPGLVAQACPHRGASLFFGRNEEDGLRCVYHGWKFDTSGACVDMPNEPAESNFKHKINVRAYPCVERGRVVFTYMGPLNPPPPFPEFEFAGLPDDRIVVRKRYSEQNWLQGLEGNIDPSHGSFLHSAINPELRNEANEARSGAGRYFQGTREAWHFEALDTDLGMMVAARRPAEDDHYFWRVNLFMLPCYSMTPAGVAGESPTFSLLAWVPVDDEHHLVYSLSYNPTGSTMGRVTNTGDAPEWRERGVPVASNVPASKGGRTRLYFVPGDPTRPGSEWMLEANQRNDYLIDRTLQRTETYTGMPGSAVQDLAVQESMGPIYDRAKEHLGTADAGIIAARRSFIRAAKALRTHAATPPGVLDTKGYMLRAAVKLLPRSVSWADGMRPYYEARPGVNLPMP